MKIDSEDAFEPLGEALREENVAQLLSALVDHRRGGSSGVAVDEKGATTNSSGSSGSSGSDVSSDGLGAVGVVYWGRDEDIALVTVVKSCTKQIGSSAFYVPPQVLLREIHNQVADSS